MQSRREWLAKAIACFRSQDYVGGAELILVADSSSEIVEIAGETYRRSPRGSKIRFAVLAGTIGAKRNLACSLAKGEIVVHFDDDDFSAPGRVTDQVSRLLESGKAVTSYRNLKFTDGERAWINRNWPGGYGTSLAYRRDWWQVHPFPEMQIGEDWEFVAEAMRAGEFVAGDAQDFLVATIHRDNTSPRQIGPNWIPCSTPDFIHC